MARGGTKSSRAILQRQADDYVEWLAAQRGIDAGAAAETAIRPRRWAGYVAPPAPPRRAGNVIDLDDFRDRRAKPHQQPPHGGEAA